MSSSAPGGVSRNGIRHSAVNTNPMTMTRLGNFGVQKNSRMASRYAMPATASGMINDGAPMLLNLREQAVSATSMTTPRTYSLRDGVSFKASPRSYATVLVP